MKTILILSMLVFQVVQADVLLTGIVESSQTQHVVMPLVRSYQGKVSEMIEEGSFVEEGDFVARIDGSELDSTIESKKEQFDLFKASSERDAIQLEIELNNANLDYEKSSVDLKVATLKAKVPVDFIGELEYKERQLTLKKSEKKFKESVNNLDSLKQKIIENEAEKKLGLKQKQEELQFWESRLDGLTINAEQSGYIVYSSHPWTGSKYQPGDQVQTGMEILKISKKNNMRVKAWVNAIDINLIAIDQAVTVIYDALPIKESKGIVNLVSSGGHDKKDWGDGLYYEIEVELNDSGDLPLLPGMSAQVVIKQDKKS